VAAVSRTAVRVSLSPAYAHLGVEPAVVDASVIAAGHPGDRVEIVSVAGDRAVLDVAGVRHHVVLGPVVRAAGMEVLEREIVIDGWRVSVHVEPEQRAALRERARRGAGEAAGTGPTAVRAVIPGRVLAVSVAVGDDVVAGQPLLLVEAMKMQNELRAPRAGTVNRVDAVAGRAVELGDVLVVLE
jgi:biotin carboxyl carrier protein